MPEPPPQIRKRGTPLGSKKTSYSLSFRHKVVKHYKDLDNLSMSQTEKHFNVHLNTFKSFFWKLKDMHLVKGNLDQRRRIRVAHHEELEEDQVKFVKLSRAHRLLVTSEVLKTKARMLREINQLTEDNFKASNGWLYSFVRRTGIRIQKLHGEAGGVNVNFVQEKMISLC